MYPYNGLSIRACSPCRIRRSCRPLLFPSPLAQRRISTHDNEVDTVNGKSFVTKSEAIYFAEDVLEIANPVRLASEDPWKFLFNFHTKMKTSVPFTNLIYFNRNGARNISSEEMKRAVFTKQGGGCLDVYPVVHAVLRFFDFETLLVAGSLSTLRTETSMSHVGLFVKNVTYPGSLHLIEPGTRHPILQPVSLKFQRYSPEYHVGHYPVRFFKTNAGIITMSTPAVDDKNVGEMAVTFGSRMWESLITYRTNEILTSRDCQKMRENIVNDSSTVPDLHDKLVIFGFSQGLWTSIIRNKFYQYEKWTGRLVMKKMKTNVEVVETMQEHFPQYSPGQVEEALLFWNP